MKVYVVLKEDYTGQQSGEFEPNVEVVGVYQHKVNAYDRAGEEQLAAERKAHPNDPDVGFEVEEHELGWENEQQRRAEKAEEQLRQLAERVLRLQVTERSKHGVRPGWQLNGEWADLQAAAEAARKVGNC